MISISTRTRPPTWRSLYEVLRELDLEELSQEIEEYLSCEWINFIPYCRDYKYLAVLKFVTFICVHGCAWVTHYPVPVEIPNYPSPLSHATVHSLRNTKPLEDVVSPPPPPLTHVHTHTHHPWLLAQDESEHDTQCHVQVYYYIRWGGGLASGPAIWGSKEQFPLGAILVSISSE